MRLILLLCWNNFKRGESLFPKATISTAQQEKQIPHLNPFHLLLFEGFARQPWQSVKSDYGQTQHNTSALNERAPGSGTSYDVVWLDLASSSCGDADRLRLSEDQPLTCLLDGCRHRPIDHRALVSHTFEWCETGGSGFESPLLTRQPTCRYP